MTRRIRISLNGETVFATKDESLADVIHRAGIPLSTYCNKKGICGKCLVEIIGGKLPQPAEQEEILLRRKKRGKRWRLACLHKVAANLEIKIPSSSLIREARILETGLKFDAPVDPAVRKYGLDLKKPDLSSPHSLFELLRASLGLPQLDISPDLLKSLPEILAQSDFRVTAVVHRNREVIAVEPSDTTARNFGLAMDIGTTTLVVSLLDLTTGKTRDTRAALNNQSRHGADVISRLSYACENEAGSEDLQSLVIETLNGMIDHLLGKNAVDLSNVYEITVAGNAVMNHLLLGLPVNTLAFSPYSAVFSSLPEQPACGLGFTVHPRAKVYLSPNIKSFVGGDIAAGFLVSGLADLEGNYLFVDLGTNGEIVLMTDRGVTASSTAAGPAFEGTNISCGMPALPGAIYKAEFKKTRKIVTFGDLPPRGVCGTGLIDLLAHFLKEGRVVPQGKILTESRQLPVSGGIFISQEDVRQVQLACAAVKTGIGMLLKDHGLEVKDLDGLYIGGAFGNYLNIRNAMAIGLLPGMEEKKVRFIGNSSLAGAKLLLLREEARDRLESLVRTIRYVPLATDPLFQESFIRSLELKPWP